MSTLVLALYTEGNSDERFLPVVIQRTVEQILVTQGKATIDVLEPILLNKSINPTLSSRDDRILDAAHRSAGYHALIIHADADHPQPQRALIERYRPGYTRVQRASEAGEAVCRELVPLIPVQMTEAWMLADPPTLKEVIGTPARAEELGIPMHPHQVESDTNPKQTLQQAIQNALAHRPRRRRNIAMETVYEPLARQMSLARLGGVPAYQQFVQDMTDALARLGLVYPRV